MGKLNDDWYDRMFELLMRQDQEDAEVILDKIAEAANRKKAAEEKQKQQSTQKELEMASLILDFDDWVKRYYGTKLDKYEPMDESAAKGVAKIIVKMMDSGYYFGL